MQVHMRFGFISGKFPNLLAPYLYSLPLECCNLQLETLRAHKYLLSFLQQFLIPWPS